ncbi:hypothetical protein DSO57_1018370 [Entomophthora muscae]|uniref:Uncharacterized protein n=1 Tax=Entomophthora muscae TaxID=34485 RepID=A0ACC2T4P6_9FUNG|nr:hypothetical protein DSO57_1018370 [Entomophthora muscae]
MSHAVSGSDIPTTLHSTTKPFFKETASAVDCAIDAISTRPTNLDTHKDLVRLAFKFNSCSLP